MALRAQMVVGLVTVAPLLAACGSGAGDTAARVSAQPALSPAPTPSQTFAPFPTPSGSPPLTPPPVTTPQPPGLDAGTPPISYTVPAGFSLNLSTPEEVQLTSVTGAEALDFAVDSSQENLSSASGTLAVGGEMGVVLRRGPDAGGYGYSEIVIVDHRGVQYELSCVGYSGYDATRLSDGCGSFVDSIAFRT